MRIFWKSMLAGMMLAVLFGMPGLVKCSHAETDVTDKVELVKSRLMFDRSTNQSYLNVSIKNISGDVLLTPIKFVIDSISSTDVTVANADGMTEDGKPYFEYTYNEEISTAMFSPAQLSNSKKIAFSNPNRLRFSFTTLQMGNLVSPTLKTISPQFGQPGSDVVLTGYNLYNAASDNEVYFGDNLAEIKQISNTSITVVVPDSAGNCKVFVRTGTETSNAMPFFISNSIESLKEIALDVDLVINDKETFESDPVIGIKKSTSRILLVLTEDVTVADMEMILSSIGAQVVGTFPEINLFVAELLNPTTVEAINQTVTQLRENTLIKIASINKTLSAAYIPDNEGDHDEWKWDNHDPNFFYGGNWGQKFAHFPGAWNCIHAIPTDTKIEIGIIDIGFFSSHPDLENVLTELDNIWTRYLENHNHGTHVAGIIGAEFGNGKWINGATPFADMYAKAPALPQDGYHWDWANQIDAVKTLIENKKVKVVNISMGWNWGSNGYGNPNNNLDMQNEVAGDGEIAQTIAKEFDDTVLIVAAAGNDSEYFNEVVDAKWSSPFTWAAANGVSNIIVVAASEPPLIESSDPLEPVTFENNAANRSNYSNAGSCITIAAPGTKIWSTVRTLNGYGCDYRDGTSFAAPMVTGLIGLMYALNPNLEPSQIIDYLTNNNEDGTGPTRSYVDPITGLNTPVIDAFGTMMRIDGFLDKVLDLNNDGLNNSDDFDIFEEAYNAEDKSAYSYSRADINGDGEIDDDDRGFFSEESPGSCGAYVAPGVWKEFDCYNLAAIGKTTNDDPFTPSWRLIGGYWQWGRKGPDESQWYDTNTPNFAHGPTGPNEADANDGEIDGWDTSNADDGAWSDDEKTANDPCPSGYRIPTEAEWLNVINYNTQTTVGTWSSSDITNYSCGWFFGDDLMLPAAGMRNACTLFDNTPNHNCIEGKLYDRGYRGMYWSSGELTSGVSSRDLFFDSSSTTARVTSQYRRSGLSVRCIRSEDVSYTVTFDSNGGAAADPATIQIEYGDTYGTLATTSRTGYTFNGWFIAASGGTQVTSETIVATASNHTLYAQWKANSGGWGEE